VNFLENVCILKNTIQIISTFLMEFLFYPRTAGAVAANVGRMPAARAGRPACLPVYPKIKTK
jgi:hypothetical protein